MRTYDPNKWTISTCSSGRKPCVNPRCTAGGRMPSQPETLIFQYIVTSRFYCVCAWYEGSNNYYTQIVEVKLLQIF
jgi:hypothetical protein